MAGSKPKPKGKPGRKKGGPRVTTHQEQAFAELYLKGVAPAECYRQAYGSKASHDTCIVKASLLLKRDNVAQIIGQARLASLQAVAMERADVIREWTQQHEADRNAFVDLRRVCCRYCHGINGEYQERRHERSARKKDYDAAWGPKKLLARTAVELAAIPEFDELGGIGYSTNNPINPDCEGCDGRGVERIEFKDTTKLPPELRRLYQGLELKKDGIALKLRDGNEALTNIAKALGVLDPKNAPQAPAPPMPSAAEAIPDDPMDAGEAYARLIKGR